MIASVNQIIDASFVDGPGNRTVVFFQGCNFRCSYCHNPETINHCIHCGQCVPNCPTKALKMENGRVIWKQDQCIDCGQCYKNCANSATPRITQYSVENIIKRIRNNLPFIRGITVSGGECSLHRDFIVELFHEAKKLKLGTLMDSNGGIVLFSDEELMKVTDGVMLDIKATDGLFHKELTGQPNAVVLQNAVELARMGKLYEIRTVVMADNPFSRKTVKEVGELMAPYLLEHNVRYKLIKFRPVGVRGEAKSWLVPSDSFMEELKESVNDKGFSPVIIT